MWSSKRRLNELVAIVATQALARRYFAEALIEAAVTESSISDRRPT